MWYPRPEGKQIEVSNDKLLKTPVSNGLVRLMVSKAEVK